jgi:1-acyl-sn-glycerol-3-phosphate acyltransferase
MAVSIAWGWLFAMGILSLIHNQISVIVIGISSVILGIAINYPLHLIAHLSHTPDMRTALKQIVSPLVVGNITTVGAFLSLVPLRSTALQDLGLFSSLLLVGTILFVLLYLPHVVHVTRESHPSAFFTRLSEVSLENKRGVVPIVLILTIIFALFSMRTQFDSNIGNINYMTSEQKADLASFQQMISSAATEKKVFVMTSDSTLDGVLNRNATLQQRIEGLKADGLISSSSGYNRFTVSTDEQISRLAKWQMFKDKYHILLSETLQKNAINEGFAEDSFDSFITLVNKDFKPQSINEFCALNEVFYDSYLYSDSIGGLYQTINVLSLSESGSLSSISEKLNNDHIYCFDLLQMNSALAQHLSDDFNFIGWSCGFIVFFFLWFSLGSIELAMLSFLPMAISWIWILGLMGMMDIRFNIVNVILATFIFGQGDDYTIFMTEGASYEYAYRRKMLSSYKSSIVLSALIMFIGMGTLIVAQHPALHSLAEVTLVGMFSVVFMAYLFPPLIFNWLVMNNGKYRQRPLYLKPVLAFAWSALLYFIQLGSVYIYGFYLFVGRKNTYIKRNQFHRYIMRLYNYDLHHMPGVTYTLNNPHKEDFSTSSMVICNHQSMLDTICFMALSTRLIIVSNSHAGMNPVIRLIFKWLQFYILTNDIEQDKINLQRYVEAGYSLVVFPEGERNSSSSILRFHKGAFYLADILNLDVIPVLLHGANYILPRNSIALYEGRWCITIGQRISKGDITWGKNYIERTKAIHHYYIKEYEKLTQKIENTTYFSPFVKDRYRYKGMEIFNEVCRELKTNSSYSKWIDVPYMAKYAIVRNNGIGAFSLLFALVHPHMEIYAYSEDIDENALARYSAEGVATNLHILDNENEIPLSLRDNLEDTIHFNLLDMNN